MPTKKLPVCSICKAVCTPTHGGCTSGYGINRQGRKVCFACCAKVDLKAMQETGNDSKVILYLDMTKGTLTVGNWPGTLTFPVLRQKISRNNWGAKRTDVWFRVPTGKGYDSLWHGVQVGEWSQVVRCRRNKMRQAIVNPHNMILIPSKV